MILRWLELPRNWREMSFFTSKERSSDKQSARDSISSATSVCQRDSALRSASRTQHVYIQSVFAPLKFTRKRRRNLERSSLTVVPRLAELHVDSDEWSLPVRGHERDDLVLDHLQALLDLLPDAFLGYLVKVLLGYLGAGELAFLLQLLLDRLPIDLKNGARWVSEMGCQPYWLEATCMMIFVVILQGGENHLGFSIIIPDMKVPSISSLLKRSQLYICWA